MRTSRRANRRLLAAALLGAALLGAAAPPAVAGGAGSLATHYPLGTQKLCCLSRSPSTANSPKSAAPPAAPSTAAGPHSSQAARPSTAARPPSLQANRPVWPLVAALLAVLLLAAAGYRAAGAYRYRHTSRAGRPARRPYKPSTVLRWDVAALRWREAWLGMRASPRPRRRAPRWMIVLLRPIMRYSAGRDAYVLRLVGRLGPVLAVERRSHRRTGRTARPLARDAAERLGTPPTPIERRR